ncbi:MAG: hypothetical protein A2Z03_12410 [Chloroflexi bacterium RBG_16_56_8]|nr:MAG: hypothetical protein A2Z03_12410 [Chloroflexi bacterium RBG_16_56_8]
MSDDIDEPIVRRGYAKLLAEIDAEVTQPLPRMSATECEIRASARNRRKPELDRVASDCRYLDSDLKRYQGMHRAGHISDGDMREVHFFNSRDRARATGAGTYGLREWLGHNQLATRPGREQELIGNLLKLGLDPLTNGWVD